MPREKELTREQAIKLVTTRFYERMTSREIATFQLFQPLMCMPFSVFHEAVEKALGRPVFTHEFGLNLDGLKKELLGERQAPMFAEIVGLIPEDKRIILQLHSGDSSSQNDKERQQ